MLGTVAYSWKPERRARKRNLHGLHFASKRCVFLVKAGK